MLLLKYEVYTRMGGARPQTALMQSIANVYNFQMGFLPLGSTHAVILANVTVGNGLNPAAVVHLNDAMRSVGVGAGLALGAVPAPAMVAANLTANANLWQTEDNVVPTHLEIDYRWQENGVMTNWRSRDIDIDIPNSLRAPYV